jgi:hypothetical protein
LILGLGASVGGSAWTLVAVNVPALWLLIRHDTWQRSSMRSALEWSFIGGLLLFLAAVPWLVVSQLRIFSSHTWLHTVIVNQFMSGAVLPEEPELAGVALVYSWLAHVYWAALCVVLDWAPTRVYGLTNVASLASLSLLVYATGRALGASATAARTSIPWVLFGTNVVGALIWLATNRLPGDIRYTPFFRKFTTFNSMPFGLALFAGLILLGVLAVRGDRGRRRPVLFGAALAACGAIYVLVFPAAFSLAVAVVVILGLEHLQGRARSFRSAFEYGAATAGAAAVALAALKLTARARATPAFELSSLEAVASKLVSAAIALAPFLLAAVVVTAGPALARGGGQRVRDLLARLEPAHLMLGLAALPVVAFGAIFHISPGYAYNEYKMMFCAALLLVPFVGVALDRWLPGAVASGTGLIASGLLALMVLAQNPFHATERVHDAPPAFEQGLTVRLSQEHVDSAWISAIRERTPPDTIVVADSSPVFLPAAAWRPLYAPVVDRVFPGVWLESREHLLFLRGYPPELVRSRLETTAGLFGARTDAELDGNLEKILRLDRPVVIVADRSRHAAMLELLAARQHGRLLSDTPRGTVVWLYGR